MNEPTVTATISDTEIEATAEALWPCIDIETALAKSAITHVGRALQILLTGGQSPAQAVRTISTIALVMSGEEYDVVAGDQPRAMLKRR